MSWLGYTYLSEQAERHLLEYSRWTSLNNLSPSLHPFTCHSSWWSGRILRSINFVILIPNIRMMSYLWYHEFIHAILITSIVRKSFRRKRKRSMRLIWTFLHRVVLSWKETDHQSLQVSNFLSSNLSFSFDTSRQCRSQANIAQATNK